MAKLACKAVVCLDSTSGSRPIMCDTCRSLFHCSCVSVSEEITLILEQQNGFFWRCNSCILNDVSAARFQKLLTIMENMNLQFSNVASNTTVLPDDSSICIDDDAMETQNDATKTPLTSKRSHSLTSSVVIPVVKKKKLDFNQPDPEAESSSGSAPASSPTVNAENDKPFNINECVIRKSDRYFHLSQFRPDTNNDDIRNHIVKKLKCRPDHITCHKLVSSKRDNRRPLTFVSFKIGTTKKLAKQIIEKGVWPKGINIKPFEDHSKNGPISMNSNRGRSRSRNHRNILPISNMEPHQQKKTTHNQQKTHHKQQKMGWTVSHRR